MANTTGQAASSSKPLKPTISIIIPVRNEAAMLATFLSPLQALRALGAELILVDGDSEDDTVAIAAGFCDQLVSSDRGRALQMNRGAACAKADVLVFLHADTLLPDDPAQVHAALSAVSGGWGFFPLRLSGKRAAFRLIERMINWRSRTSAIATGDQCLFAHRRCFQQLGGYPAIALMEDVALCRRLRRLAKPSVMPWPVQTSSRRWEQRGIVKTVVEMWVLRLAFCLGVSPQRLAKLYYG